MTNSKGQRMVEFLEKYVVKVFWSRRLLMALVAEELNNTHIKLALFRLLFTNKWVIYLDKLPIYWLD